MVTESDIGCTRRDRELKDWYEPGGTRIEIAFNCASLENHRARFERESTLVAWNKDHHFPSTLGVIEINFRLDLK